MYSVGMESLLTILIIILLLGNFLAIVFLIKRKQPEPVNNEQIFKDELSSLKNTFSQSFGSMSKEIAKDMTGALTKVDEKVSVFNQQVSELNKSQETRPLRSPKARLFQGQDSWTLQLALPNILLER